MSWLYRTEAKGIQGYVLATDKLREMIGASALVEELPKRLVETLGGPGEVLAAAAGHATIRFDDERALERFRALWPLQVARGIPGLTVVQAWRLLEGDDEQAVLQRLIHELRAESSRPWVDLPEAGPWVARAGRTGLPAVAFGWGGPHRGNVRRDGKVDRSTCSKLVAFCGRDGDGGRGDAPSDDADPERMGAADALGKTMRPEGAPPLAADHSHFPKDYVAVIHADGNGVGQLVASGRLGSLARYAQFAEALAAATREAARQAVEAVWTLVRDRDEGRDGSGRGRYARPLPIRPVVLGGDDLTVIVSARYAIPFTAAFLRGFEALTREHFAREGLADLGGLTAAAGIAVVKKGFPFHEGYELAEQLCRFAKDHGAQGRGTASPRPSQLQFHRVTTPSVREWREVRVKELKASDGVTPLWAGPWNLEQLGRLQAIGRALAEAPRGAVREWLRLAHEDMGRAKRHWRRVREVLRDGARKDLDAALRGLDVDRETLWTSAEEAKHRRSPIAEATTWRAMDPGFVIWPNALHEAGAAASAFSGIRG